METTTELGKIDLKTVTAEQLAEEKSAPVESEKEGSFHFSLADLGASITSSLNQSVAASEFRSLEFQNLDHWELDDLKQLLDLGVNRFSVGIQSLNAQTLKKLDRVHSVEDVFKTLSILKKLKVNKIKI